MLGRLAESGLLSGKTVGVDATTLEANAALRSIVRRDSGDDYDTFLRGLAEASGVETPTRASLARFDRKRKKKMSNEEWENPHDPDAEITKMKDGRTHLAYKAEQAVDLEYGTILGVTVQGGSKGDTASFHETLEETFEQVETVTGDDATIKEIVADKGYHSNALLADIAELGLRSYISEPDRGRRRWKGKKDLQAIVYANRRRNRGNRGKRMQRQRGERLERPCAHQYETGGMRRLHLRGRSNVLKRVYIHACGCNLGLLMRELVGVGTPRSLQGRASAARNALAGQRGGVWPRLVALYRRIFVSWARKPDPLAIQHLPPRLVPCRTTHLTGPPPRATKPLLPRAARHRSSLESLNHLPNGARASISLRMTGLTSFAARPDCTRSPRSCLHRRKAGIARGSDRRAG